MLSVIKEKLYIHLFSKITKRRKFIILYFLLVLMQIQTENLICFSKLLETGNTTSQKVVNWDSKKNCSNNALLFFYGIIVFSCENLCSGQAIEHT